MSDKKYTPYEAAVEVLKKAQEVYNKHKEEPSDVDKCGDMKTVGKKEEKKEDLKKLMSSSSTVPGSVATTGGPSIGSQIGFGKSDKKEYSGAVGDVDPKIISDMKSKLSDSKKNKKLPEFLKKKKMKKALNDSSQASAAPKAPKSGSPQPISVSSDTGWDTKKNEEKK